MTERPGYWERRRVCRDYYRKCRKGRLDKLRSKLRKKDETSAGERSQAENTFQTTV